MTAIDTKLVVVRSEAEELIRDEVRAMGRREQLERACYEAVDKMGCTVDEVSEASGLRPSEIRLILESKGSVGEELDALAGFC